MTTIYSRKNMLTVAINTIIKNYNPDISIKYVHTIDELIVGFEKDDNVIVYGLDFTLNKTNIDNIKHFAEVKANSDTPFIKLTWISSDEMPDIKGIDNKAYNSETINDYIEFLFNAITPLLGQEKPYTSNWLYKALRASLGYSYEKIPSSLLNALYDAYGANMGNHVDFNDIVTTAQNNSDLLNNYMLKESEYLSDLPNMGVMMNATINKANYTIRIIREEKYTESVYHKLISSAHGRTPIIVSVKETKYGSMFIIKSNDFNVSGQIGKYLGDNVVSSYSSGSVLVFSFVKDATLKVIKEALQAGIESKK